MCSLWPSCCYLKGCTVVKWEARSIWQLWCHRADWICRQEKKKKLQWGGNEGSCQIYWPDRKTRQLMFFMWLIMSHLISFYNSIAKMSNTNLFLKCTHWGIYFLRSWGSPCCSHDLLGLSWTCIVFSVYDHIPFTRETNVTLAMLCLTDNIMACWKIRITVFDHKV